MSTSETAPPSPAKFVVVDIGERQSPEDVNSLRKGEGQLIDHIERIMQDLAAAGTVAGEVQPVIFVVREMYEPGGDDEVDDDLDDFDL